MKKQSCYTNTVVCLNSFGTEQFLLETWNSLVLPQNKSVSYLHYQKKLAQCSRLRLGKLAAIYRLWWWVGSHEVWIFQQQFHARSAHFLTGVKWSWKSLNTVHFDSNFIFTCPNSVFHKYFSFCSVLWISRTQSQHAWHIRILVMDSFKRKMVTIFILCTSAVFTCCHHRNCLHAVQ